MAGNEQGERMTTQTGKSSDFDLEKFRLRGFVDRLIEMDEVEIHEEPVALTALAPSMRLKATRCPPASQTATLNVTLSSSAFARAA